MKKLLLPFYLCVILSLMLGSYLSNVTPKAESYQAEPEPPREIQFIIKYNWTEERIAQEIEEQAEKYGVSAHVMKTVIECESMGSTTVQSYHKLKYGREQSYGLAQIHLPDHPGITKEQAQDPKFAIEFMAEEMSEGRSWKWTCYRNNF